MNNSEREFIKEKMEWERKRQLQLTNINLIVKDCIGSVSDGYHDFNDLYHHRTILFSVICNQNKELSWKSKLHNDGTMYQDYFIAGINTPLGQYTYHQHIDYWDKFNIKEIEKAPEWDGHKPSDIIRLNSLPCLDFTL